MSKEIQLSLEEFRKQLKPQQVRVFQIISLALGTGVFLFFLIVLGTYWGSSETPGTQESSNLSVIKILTLVHILEAGFLYILSFFLYRFLVSQQQLKKILKTPPPAGVDPATPPEGRCIGIILTGTLIRLAMFEGTALFGLITCLLGATDGTLRQYPVYWLNLFSLVFMILFVLVTFPTRQRLEDIFQARFGDPNVYQEL